MDERYALRQIEAADAPWIAAACTDPDIQRWTHVPRPYTLGDAEAFVADGAGSLFVWAVIDPATDEGLATIAVHEVADGVATLGYWVAPWARRRGVAAWATDEVVRRLAARPDVTTAALEIADTNTASRAVARRAGFTAVADPEMALTAPDGDAVTAATQYVRPVRPERSS